MKKSYLLINFLIVILLSCNKSLDRFPLDSPSNVTFYSTEAEIVAAVNACYNYMTVRTEWPYCPIGFSEDMSTDILDNRNSISAYTQFKRGELAANHTLPSLIWNNDYAGINRTNSLLENMSKAEASSNAVIFKRVKSEARVIRAICYMELIQKFGDVPLVTKFIDVNEGLNLTRTPKLEVLQFIYKELDEAAVDLPLKYTVTNEKGRITRGAAYAMKARIALYNGDWAIAKKAAKDCMDLNVYKMYTNYRNLFTYAAQYNDEIVLDCQYMQLQRESAWIQFNGPRNSNGQSQSFVTEDMVSSFECTDGKPIHESPLYNPKNPFTNRDPRLFGAVIVPRVWDGTTISTSGTVFNGFEFMSSKEILKSSTGAILPASLSEREKTVLNQITGATVANQEVTNAFSARTGYCVYKYTDEKFVATPQNVYLNFILCRYAEVLLIYAEAAIESGTVDQSVLDALNTVRARAYGNTNSSGVTNINALNYPKITTTDITELRKIVRRERKVELCFEGFRYEDLKRWGILVKALNLKKIYGRSDNYTKLAATNIPLIDADGLMTFPYADETYGLTNEQKKLRFYETYGIITDKHKLYPIPLGEIQLNPKLIQNPGY